MATIAFMQIRNLLHSSSKSIATINTTQKNEEMKFPADLVTFTKGNRGQSNSNGPRIQ